MADIRSLSWVTPEISAAQAYYSKRFEDLYAGKPVSGPVALNGRMYGHSHGLWGTNDPDPLNQPSAWIDDVLTDMVANASETANMKTFKPLLAEFDVFGTHYIDALFGAKVYFHEGQVWSEPLDCDMADIAMPDLSKNEVFVKSVALARKVVEVSQGRFFISNPVLSCPINIGINIFGDKLLWGLVERPDAARHALRIINNVILECMKAFNEAIPCKQHRTGCGNSRYAPDGFGLIDGCATQLVSAGHYAEFFAPLDAELLGAYANGGMIHLCGAHAQHIPAWRSMKKLRSVQINDRAADDLLLYAKGLRPDQVIYVGATANTPMSTILEVAKTRPIVIQGDT